MKRTKNYPFRDKMNYFKKCMGEFESKESLSTNLTRIKKLERTRFVLLCFLTTFLKVVFGKIFSIIQNIANSSLHIFGSLTYRKIVRLSLYFCNYQ